MNKFVVFFSKCTKYKSLFLINLVRLVFLSLLSLANSQGFAPNHKVNFHENTVPSRKNVGLGFRVKKKMARVPPCGFYLEWILNIQFLQILLINIFCKHFLLINIFLQVFFVDQHFLHFYFCIFC